MSRIMISTAGRRILPLIGGLFLLIIVLTIYSNPTWNEKTSHYLKSTHDYVKDNIARPGYSYLTGTKDPDHLIVDFEHGAEQSGAQQEEKEQSEHNTHVAPAAATTHATTLVTHTSTVGATAHTTTHDAAGSTGTPRPDIDNALNIIEDEEDEFPAKELKSYIVDPDIHEIPIGNVADTHYLVRSISGKDGRYVDLDFVGHTGLNPSIIPHPYIKGSVMMVAQRDKDERTFSPFFAEMVCEATFDTQRHALVCNPNTTSILPIQFSDRSEYCPEAKDRMLPMLNMNIGPHDARVFMGPKSSPWIMYGSQSGEKDVCFGQYLQALQALVEWGPFIDIAAPYMRAQEIARPPPVRSVEKNYFVFWGPDEEMYAHYDLEPRRVFARIDEHGRHVGGNLARLSRRTDEVCWEKWTDNTAFANGTHQATNSLTVTLCKKSDPTCKPTDANTFIFTIFQKKLSYAGHAFYLPYIMLFQRHAPFAMHALTKKPFWIEGQRPGGVKIPQSEEKTVHGKIDYAYYQHEMIYVTAMNYKVQNTDYHGYLDDEIWVSFGREDTWMGAIDLTAETLLGDLEEMIYCPTE